MIRSYRDLEVWQKAMDFVEGCYKISRKFPRHEMFGLAGQMQRAAVSVAANIAEGRGRQHRQEFIQHLSIAYASLAETETHILVAERLGYVDSEQVRKLLEESGSIGRMLNGLMRSLRSRPLTPDPRSP